MLLRNQARFALDTDVVVSWIESVFAAVFLVHWKVANLRRFCSNYLYRFLHLFQKSEKLRGFYCKAIFCTLPSLALSSILKWFLNSPWLNKRTNKKFNPAISNWFSGKVGWLLKIVECVAEVKKQHFKKSCSYSAASKNPVVIQQLHWIKSSRITLCLIGTFFNRHKI